MKKKIVTLGMIICLIFIFAGCGSSDNNTTNTDTTTTQDDNSGIGEDDSSNTDVDTEDTNTSDDTTIDTTTDTTSQSSGKLTSDDGGLELESKNQDGDNIVGTIKNLTNDPYSYVEVDINLYDSNGNQVDSTLTNATNLDGNGTWNFSAPVINQNNVAQYRVVSIKGMR